MPRQPALDDMHHGHGTRKCHAVADTWPPRRLILRNQQLHLIGSQRERTGQPRSQLNLFPTGLQ